MCNPEEILRYIEGDLPPEDAARVRAHTSSCARCRDILAAEQALARELDALRALEPPPDFASAIRLRAQHDVTHAVRSPREWRRAASVAAGLSAVALLLLWPTGTLASVLGVLGPVRCLSRLAVAWVSNAGVSAFIIFRTLSRNAFEEAHLPPVVALVLLALLVAILARLVAEYRKHAAGSRDPLR